MNHWSTKTESVHYFQVGSRVELHPSTDAWMAGDRYGTVKAIGRKYLHVHMDRSGRVRRVAFDNAMSVR